jgi:hypothetical protein
MNRRLLIPLITAGIAAASGVASANPQYWRDNGLLLEVSADPRDGTDHVQTRLTRAGSLELVALNDTVRARGLTVHFSDGRSFSTSLRNIRPGDPVIVDLPPNCGAIASVVLDYGRQIVDRTPARLQIIPRADRVARPSLPGRSYDSGRYSYQPAYSTPSYVVRPAAKARVQGRIQAHFAF